MAKGTVSRKQLLKEPDQFITFSGKMIAFGQSHSKSILIGAGLVVALLLIIITARQFANRNELKASEEVEKAMAKYAAALSETDPEQAYGKVKDDFVFIFDKYGSKASGKLARILYGDVSYEAKDADVAIDMYSIALEAYDQAPAMKNIVLSRLSHAYLLKKENQKAIQTFERITAGEDTTMKYEALFNLALLYENAGNKEKSAALFNQLQTDFPANIYSDLVKEKING
jgi:tetratricopeptide (TPR) repeat protein